MGGSFDHLWHNSWNGTSWFGWDDLGRTLASGPAAAARAPQTLDVFARFTGDYIHHRSYDFSAGGWSEWAQVPSTMTFKGGPAACSWGGDRIDLSAVGADNHLYHKWWNGSTWLP